MPVPSLHIELALYADDTTIIATSRKPALLVSYLESIISRRPKAVTEWRIAINVSKSNAMLFAKAGWRVSKPQPVQFLGEPIQWVDTARYFGVILDSRMTWSPHIVQVRKKAAQRLGLFGSLLHSNGQIHED
jgi:hypothetical protein